MRKIKVFAFIFFLMFSLFADKPVFYFFHSETCPHCVEASPFVDELIKKYPQIEFKKLEVSGNLENKELYIKKVEELKIDKPGVPVFALEKSYIIGFDDSYKKKIEAMIEKEIKKDQ